MSGNTKPWERQQDESSKAFEAFAAYRDQGKSRTVVSVAEKLRKSGSLLRRWKDKYDWEERARAYDNDLERKAHAQTVKNLSDMYDRHTRIASNLIGKALKALETLDEESMSPRDINEMIRLGSTLERLSRIEKLNEEQSRGSAEDGASVLIQALKGVAADAYDPDTHEG